MSLERDSGGSATVDAGPSIADQIGSLFGDFIPESAPDTPSDTDAGAPPADASAATASPDSLEGSAADAERTGTPPDAAAIAEPDAAVSEPPVDDPLKDASPFGYTVNGQARTAEGIRVLKDGDNLVGAVVDAEFLPKLERVFTERDHLFEQQQAQHQKYSDLERLTAWTTRRQDGFKPDGSPNYVEQTLTGAQAVEASRVLTARTVASYAVLDQALRDPQTFASLVDFKQDGDQIVVVPNATQMRSLRIEMENAAIKAEQSARSHLSKLTQPQPAEAAPAAQANPADYAEPTITALTKEHGIANLSDTDRAFLTAEFPRYVITTKDGMQVDPRFVDVLKDRAAMRAELSKVAVSAGSAGKENAAKLAAAAAGKRPQPSRTIARQPQPSVPQQREANADQAWAIAERASAATMRHKVG